MTYILGSRCQDGVVLVGDRKLTAETSYSFEEKIFMDVPPVVLASSGVYGLFDKFRNKVAAHLAEHPQQPAQIFLEAIENFTLELNETYRERLRGQVFDVLAGVRGGDRSVLYHVQPNGFAEPVKRYRVIGHGEPYGSVFLKGLWRTDITMTQVAELGYFIVKYIERFELDSSVGVGSEHLQIWLIPDAQSLPIDQAPATWLDAFKKKTESNLQKLDENLHTLSSWGSFI
jgi:20S proteasome alpha/beta subunit